MKRFPVLFAVLFLSVGLAAQMTSAPAPAPVPASGATPGNQTQTTGGVAGAPAAGPLVTTPSMDLGGPLTPPVVRTTPTVMVVTPSPLSTPTLVVAPAEAPQTPAGDSRDARAPMNLGASRAGTVYESSDTRSLGEIAAQYRKQERIQNASRVYTNADIARLNREQARDLDMPMSDRDDSAEENKETDSKTTPVPPPSPR